MPQLSILKSKENMKGAVANCNLAVLATLKSCSKSLFALSKLRFFAQFLVYQSFLIHRIFGVDESVGRGLAMPTHPLILLQQSLKCKVRWLLCLLNPSAKRTTALMLCLLMCPTIGMANVSTARHGMVVSSQHLATQAGLAILEQGGNAIDAAIAVGYALAVVHPCCGNLGGGGFMLLHLANGTNRFLNFREKAPLNIDRRLFFDNSGKAVRGALGHSHQVGAKPLKRAYLAVGVPGTVMGLNEALKRYGTLSLKQVVSPAIQLADKGFILDEQDARILYGVRKSFRDDPYISTIFLKQHGHPYQAGDRLVQKDLAHTLRAIARHGTQAFYKGTIRTKLLKASRLHGGVFKKEDFEQYTVQWLSPITCHYRGYDIVSAPPPSSGGVTLCEILNILSGYPMSQLQADRVTSLHYLIEAMRYAFADRNRALGDPDFVDNPIEKLLSPKHASRIRNKIHPYYATRSETIGFTSHPEGAHTTHYTVADRWGNVVAVTITLNSYFGARVMPKDTGFFLNNEMDDFALDPNLPNIFGLRQGQANLMVPGKRPLSSMSPTIVLKKDEGSKDQLIWALGSPGGPTIITQMAKVLYELIDLHYSLPQAMDALRIHMQWLPDTVFYELGGLPTWTRLLLRNRGYRFQLGSPFNTLYWGAIAAIYRTPKGLWLGVSDRRRTGGLALGL